MNTKSSRQLLYIHDYSYMMCCTTCHLFNIRLTSAIPLSSERRKEWESHFWRKQSMILGKKHKSHRLGKELTRRRQSETSVASTTVAWFVVASDNRNKEDILPCNNSSHDRMLLADLTWPRRSRSFDSLAVHLEVLAFIVAVKEFPVEQLHCDDGKYDL